MINTSQNSQNSNNSNGSNNSNQNKPHTYKVVKLIGEGSFGKAYLVECNTDKVIFILKYYLIYLNRKILLSRYVLLKQYP